METPWILVNRKKQTEREKLAEQWINGITHQISGIHEIIQEQLAMQKRTSRELLILWIVLIITLFLVILIIRKMKEEGAV